MSKAVTLSDLNELYMESYKNMGIDTVYDILKNYNDRDKRHIIKYHAAMLVCREFNFSTTDQLLCLNNRGNGRQALIGLFLLIKMNTNPFQLKHYIEFTKFPYQIAYQIKRESENIDIKLKPNAKFMSQVDSMDAELKTFIKELKTKK